MIQNNKDLRFEDLRFEDLVLVRHLNSPAIYLFSAPDRSGIKTGDVVICDTSIGEALGFVMADPITAYKDGVAEKFAATACNATLPLKKVLRKAFFADLEYKNEEGTK